MIRAALAILTALISVAVGVGVAARTGVGAGAGVLAAGATALVLAAGFAGLHTAWVTVQARRDGPDGETPRVLFDAAALFGVTRGEASFTRGLGHLTALELAVLAPGNVDPDGATLAVVTGDVRRSTPEARRRIVDGLRRIHDDAIDGLLRPTHPLFRTAPRILTTIAFRVAPFVGAMRAPAEWERRRDGFDPARAEEAIAARLIQVGMPSAALEALAFGDLTPRCRRLMRLARFCSILRDAARGVLLGGTSEIDAWDAELTLLAGRRLQELVPGSPFLARVPGGAATLERIVAQTPQVAAELALVHVEYPDLETHVATVLARILGWPVGTVVNGLRGGTLTAQPDAPLQSHLRGLALLNEGRGDEAVAEFEAALRHAPGFAQAAFALATLRRLGGDPQSAENLLRSLVETRPRDADARLYLARFLDAAGRRDESRTVFDEAVSRFPHSVRIRVAYALHLESDGDDPAAADQLAAARRRQPHDPRLALLAARVFVGVDRYDDAITALTVAAGGVRGQELSEARFWQMTAHRARGEHHRAESLARRLVRTLGRGQERMLDDVADYLEERHDFQHAREAVERARRLRGDDR